MLHHFKKIVRKAWHDIYYFWASKKGVDFALTCREATENIDLNDQAKTAQGKLRVKLHISLCQACNNYYSFSRSLSRALKKLVQARPKTDSDLDKLNNELVQKFSK